MPSPVLTLPPHESGPILPGASSFVPLSDQDIRVDSAAQDIFSAASVLRALLPKHQLLCEAKNEILQEAKTSREIMQQLRSAKRDIRANGTVVDLSKSPHLVPLFESLRSLGVDVPTGNKLDARAVEALLDAIESEFGRRSDMGEHTMLRLKHINNADDELLRLLSSIISRMHDLATEIIRNFK